MVNYVGRQAGNIEPCWGIVMCTPGPVLGWELRVMCTLGISQLYFSTGFLSCISKLYFSVLYISTVEGG